jgi:ribosomal protein S27AE
MHTSKENGLNNTNVRCPQCGNPMQQLASDHHHCNCGVCLYRGIQLQWHRSGEKKTCVDTWVKDPWIKTGNLA